MELVEAHTEEAAKARQESALNAAKFRRVSREIPQPIVAAALKATADGETASLSERALGKIHPSAGNRYAMTTEESRESSPLPPQKVQARVAREELCCFPLDTEGYDMEKRSGQTL